MSMIHNERTKLLANNIDRASTACLTVGVLAPIVAAIYTPASASLWIFVAVTGFWLFAAAALHLIARHILGRLI